MSYSLQPAVSPAGGASLRGSRLRTAARLLLDEGPLSRATLARRSGYSPASMTATIRDLVHLGLVMDTGKASTTGGRPASLLGFDRSAVLMTLLSFTDHRLTASQIDLSGHELVRIVRDVKHLDTPGVLTEALHTLSAAAAKPSRCVAVSLPGVVAADGSVSSAPAVGLKSSMELRSHLGEVTGLPVLIENDVNLLALGEAARGAAKDRDDVGLVYIGAGIGGAVVREGKIEPGATRSAGEIGFLPYGGVWAAPGDTEGPFEREWSLAAVNARLIRDGLDWESVTAATPVVDAALDAWSYAALVTCCVADPATIVFAGDVCELPQGVLDELTRRVTSRSPHPVDVAFAWLGQGGVAAGVVELVSSNAELFLPDPSPTNHLYP